MIERNLPRKLLRGFFVLFLGIWSALAQVSGQERDVTGRVTGAEDGEPIPGVTILVKGTTVGTISDFDGNYVIKVPAGGTTLIFSFVGMLTQEVAITSDMINIILEAETKQMDEVVVTALGIKREKKALGYAVTEVKGDEIAESSTISPVTALQGKVAGVDIAPSDGGTFGGTRITIRGNSTLGDNNQPIYVVDGVILDNDISGGDEWGGTDWGNELKNLNPDDFESVSILKGSAATALYGSRALHGAIVITTKQGKARKGIGVNISQTVNWKRVYSGPDFQNTYGEGAPPGYDSDHEDKYYPQGSFPINTQGEPYLKGDWTPLSYGHPMDGSKIRDWNGEWIDYWPQKDNYEDSFEKGLYSNTNISLDGGNDRTTFRLSYSYTDEGGVYPQNDFSRNAISTRVTHKITDYLQADVSLSYAAADLANPPSGGFQQAFVTASWPRNYNTNKWKHNYKAPHGGIPREQYDDPNWMVPDHARWFSTFENSYTRLEETLRLNAKLNIDITDYLNLILEGNLNNFYIKSETKELGQGYANEGGKYSLGHERKEQSTIKFLANFNKTFAEDWATSFSIGGEMWSSATTGTSAATNGGLIVPGQYSIDNSKNTAIASGYTSNERKLNSLYFFGEVAWKNFLFINITGRNDWSSTLTYLDGSGNNSYFYPSISGSWVFSETWELPTWITFGKVRASYAEVGNDFKPYDINSGYKKQGNLENALGDLPYYTYSSKQVPNTDLKPERKRAYEFGLDMNFLNNRIGFEFTYYNENTFDQILSLSVPGESGVTSQLINAGKIQNQGIEFTLHTTPLDLGDFRWDLDFNYTRNRNKIIELTEGVTEFNLEGSSTYGNTRVATVAYVGGEYGLLVSDSAPLLFENEDNTDDPRNGMPILKWHTSQRGAYQLRSFEKQVVGNINPDWLGSINTSFSYKNWHLRALFDIRVGGDIVSYSNRYGMAYGLLEESLAYRDLAHGGFEWTSDFTGNTYEDGYIPDGVFEDGTVVDGNDVSGLTYRDAYEKGLIEPMHGSYWHWKNNNWGLGIANDNVVMESSYVGIREIIVGYTLPREWAEKVHLQSVDVSIFGRDLGFIYNSLPNNLNPFSIRSNRAGAAHEWGLSPFTRTYGFTLKLGI